MSLSILRIVPSISLEAGGVAEGVIKSSLELINQGLSIYIASLEKEESDHLSINSITNIFLGKGLLNYGFSLDLTSKLTKIINMNSIDLVIIEGIWQYHSICARKACLRSGTPYVIFTHGMLDPWFRKAYPIKHIKKQIYWPWGDYRVLRDAKAVLFTTEKERHLARESFVPYSANEIVVGYGTAAPPPDTKNQREAFLKQFPYLESKRILLFMSRIHPKKGLDLLIEAFATIASSDQSLHLVIAGPDQIGMRSLLQIRASELRIDKKITWTGMLCGEHKWGAFRCAELFCLPSHQENFGVVVAEALACELPVAISDQVNIATDVENENAGIIHKDTATATSIALKQWLEMSVNERKEMGRRGKNLFTSRFDLASVNKRLLTVLKMAAENDSN